MPFPTVIPDLERYGVQARKFLDYVTPHLSPPAPPQNPLPEAPAMPEGLPGGMAMPDAMAPPPTPAPMPPPDLGPPAPAMPQNGFDPGAAMQPPPPPAPMPPPDLGPPAPPMPGGFDPTPPPPDPLSEAQRFAEYVQPHLEASQNGAGGLPGAGMPDSAPPSLQGPPGPVGGGFAPAPATNPADEAARFADYTRQTAGVDPSGDRPPSEFEPPSQVPPVAPAQDGGAVGGSWADDPMRPGLPPRREPLPEYPIPDVIGRGLGALRDVQQAGSALDEATFGPGAERQLDEQAQQQAAQTGQTVEEARRDVQTAFETAQGLMGSPLHAIESAAGAVRGLAPAARRLGQPGMSLEVTGGLEDAASLAGKAAGEVERLRLDKFPEAVRDTIEAAATDANFWRKQRRGVIPDEAAEEMADRLGRSVDQLIAGGRAGRAYNTEELRAIRNGVVAQAVKVGEIAEQIAQDPTGAPPRLIAEQVAEGLKLADLTRVAEGARAEAGRALGAHRAFAREFAADPTNAVQRIFRAANLTPDQAAAKANEFATMTRAGAGPQEMANFWARLEKPPPNAVDWFNLVRYNSMLSGPRTLMVNTLGNATEIPWRGLRDVGASVARGRPEEIVPEAIGIGRGFQRGIGAFLETLQHGISAEQAAAGELPRAISARMEPGVGRTAALGLEAPGRVMQATDDLFRQTAYGMALGRQAALKASEEGLRGRALLRRADELFANPTAGMMTTAGAIADRMTYKGDLGPVASKIAGLQQIPVLGNILVPFLKTVAHITSRGIERSPAGIPGTLFDVARGAYKGGKVPAGQAPLGERVADNLAGSVAFAGLSYLAAQGKISGAGPEDPEVRDMLRAQGWQPYSLKIGDKWVGYQQFGPFAVPLSLAAGWAEAQRYAKPGATQAQMGLDTFRRGAQLLVEQPYLQGVGAIYKGMTDPGRYGERWVEGFLGTLVPYGAAINTAGQVMDPTQREPRKGDILGAVASRIPGLREQLPARQDVLGRPMESEQAGLGALVPARTTTDRPDPTLGALLDVGLQIPDPPREIRNVTLSPDESRLYQRVAGDALSKRVTQLTGSASWSGLTPTRQKTLLADAVETARTKAANETERSIGSAEWRRRQLEAERKLRATPVAIPRP